MKVVCPKCGSDQLTANKKGFSGGKAVAGAILTGGIGLLAGTIGSSKVKITCLACGKTFAAGEGKKVYEPDENIPLTPQQQMANMPGGPDGCLKFFAITVAVIVLIIVIVNNIKKSDDPAPKEIVPPEGAYAIVDGAGTDKLTVWVKDKDDTMLIHRVNDYYVKKYNPDKNSYFNIYYFNDSTIAKTYFDVIGNVSEKKAERLSKHFIANYFLNPKNKYEKLSIGDF